MANPRQRRKTRSSTHRPVSCSRNAKRNLKKAPSIHAPKVLQMAWDKKKTVNQNYAELGLVHTLNPLQSGGTETSQSHHEDVRIPESETNLFSTSHPVAIPQGFGKIIRDANGTVVRVEIPEEGNDSDRGNVALPEPRIDTKVLSMWTTGVHSQPVGGTTVGVVEALEQISSAQTALHNLSFAISGVGARHASTGEVAYLQKLVNKYGEDVERMAKDRKLNPEQRTVGQLRSALRRVQLSIISSG